MARGMAFFSGGKDCVFAVMKAKENGIPVDLLIFNTHDFPRPNVHEMNRLVVEKIAELMGIPLVTLHLKEGEEYAILSKLFSDLDVGTVTVGCINAPDQLRWYDRLCEEVGASLYAPLWVGDGAETLGTLRSQIRSGIKPMIVDLDSSILPAQLLGRIIDTSVISELAARTDPCGEGGEYHTLVLDSPLMRSRISIERHSVLEVGNRRMMKIEGVRVV